jgi:hypothetical protein
MKLRPTPSQERWLRLARRLGANPEAAPFAAHIGHWRTAGLFSRCLLFVLGLVAAAMAWLVIGQLDSGAASIVTALLCLGAAAWLILARRYFASGIEEGLEVAALGLLAGKLWSDSGHSQTLGGLFLGTALTVAGLRALNPLLTCLAALAFVLALDAPPAGAALTCYATAVIALAAGGRQFARPSYDSMLDCLVIVLPIAGYLWYTSAMTAPVDYRHAALTAWLVPLVPLVFGAATLAVGLRRRAHAPLLAAMACIGFTAYELRTLSGWSLQVRLIVWGTALLVLATVLERYLRVPRGGITSVPREEETAIPVLGSAALAAQAPGAAHAGGVSGGGGQFDGAGASGRF